MKRSLSNVILKQFNKSKYISLGLLDKSCICTSVTKQRLSSVSNPNQRILYVEAELWLNIGLRIRFASYDNNFFTHKCHDAALPFSPVVETWMKWLRHFSVIHKPHMLQCSSLLLYLSSLTIDGTRADQFFVSTNQKFSIQLKILQGVFFERSHPEKFEYGIGPSQQDKSTLVHPKLPEEQGITKIRDF